MRDSHPLAHPIFWRLIKHMDVENVTDELLIQNSILAFIHNYKDHKWIDKYKELLSNIENGKYKVPEVRKRGRSAQRQKKAPASKDMAS